MINITASLILIGILLLIINFITDLTSLSKIRKSVNKRDEAILKKIDYLDLRYQQEKDIRIALQEKIKKMNEVLISVSSLVLKQALEKMLKDHPEGTKPKTKK